MIELFGGAVGGLGLFVVGMWFLTENLKKLASRRLRRTAQRLTGHPFAAFCWGVLAGGATQSMTALVFIVVSILRSGLITTKTAFALTLGGGAGATLLVLIVTLDIRTASLFVLGIAGMAVATEAMSKYRSVSASFLGGAMIVLGLTLLKDAAAPLSGQPWFQDMLEWTGDSPALAFLVAAVLTAVVQSSGAVTVFGVSLAAVGVLTVDQAIMAIYGTFVGSCSIMYILSINLTGRSRQIAMYLVYWNLVLCTVALSLFYAELHLGVPSVKALILSLALELDQQLALVYVIVSIAPIPVLFLLLGPTTWLFERLWPVSSIDELSKAQFIYDHASVDIGTSAMLADLEQKRIFRMLSQYFEAVRQDSDLAPIRGACRNLLAEVAHFLDELHNTHPMQGVESRNMMMSRQKLLSWVENAVAAMCDALLELKDRPGLEKFRTDICEGMDAVFLSVADAMETEDEVSWSIAAQLLGDRGALMRGMRARYLELDSPLLNPEAMNVLFITNAVEETFFLMTKIEAEFNPHSGAEEHVPHA